MPESSQSIEPHFYRALRKARKAVRQGHISAEMKGAYCLHKLREQLRDEGRFRSAELSAVVQEVAARL